MRPAPKRRRSADRPTTRAWRPTLVGPEADHLAAEHAAEPAEAADHLVAIMRRSYLVHTFMIFSNSRPAARSRRLAPITGSGDEKAADRVGISRKMSSSSSWARRSENSSSLSPSLALTVVMRTAGIHHACVSAGRTSGVVGGEGGQRCGGDGGHVIGALPADDLFS